MPVSIHNTSQLSSILHQYKRMDFIFELPGLSADENKYWLKKIKENYFACGCKTGKTYFTYAIQAVFLGLLFMYFFEISLLTINTYLWSAAFIFLMAGVGKTVGKLLAHKKLKNDLATLASIIKKAQQDPGLFRQQHQHPVITESIIKEEINKPLHAIDNIDS